MASPKQNHFLFSMTGRNWWTVALTVEQASTLISTVKAGCDHVKEGYPSTPAINDAVDAVREHFADFTQPELRYRWSGRKRKSGQTDHDDDKPKTENKPATDQKKPKDKPKPTKATGLQAQLEALIVAGLANVLVVGPAGCGKTTCVQLAAEALERECTMIPCSLGTPAYTFTGRRHPISGEYEETEFTKAYAAGHVILLDEVDSLDPAVACAVNAALANGHLATPKGAIERNAQTVVIATANTWGNGADRQYVGRNQLDAATLDRFSGGRVQADYSTEYEAQYDAEVVQYCHKVREHVKARNLRRIVSTRMIQACHKLKAAGLPWQDQVTADWSASEREGVAA